MRAKEMNMGNAGLCADTVNSGRVCHAAAGDLQSATVCIWNETSQAVDWLSRCVASHGFALLHLAGSADVVAGVRAMQPDVLCLVRQSGGSSLVQLCRKLRELLQGILVVVLERCTVAEETALLDSGADEVLPATGKDALPRARIDARLRDVSRRHGYRPAEVLSGGAMVVNRSKRGVTVDGSAIDLTTLEYDVLCYLVENSGRVVTRDDIRQALAKAANPAYDRSVDMYISRIRRKIGDDHADPRYLKTVRGAGYLFMGEVEWAGAGSL